MQKKSKESAYILPVRSFSLERLDRVCQLAHAGVWCQLAPRMAEILQMEEKHNNGQSVIQIHPRAKEKVKMARQSSNSWFGAPGAPGAPRAPGAPGLPDIGAPMIP